MAKQKPGFEYPKSPCISQPELKSWGRPHLLTFGQDKQPCFLPPGLPVLSLSNETKLSRHIWKESKSTLCHLDLFPKKACLVSHISVGSTETFNKCSRKEKCIPGDLHSPGPASAAWHPRSWQSPAWHSPSGWKGSLVEWSPSLLSCTLTPSGLPFAALCPEPYFLQSPASSPRLLYSLGG